MYGPGFLFNHSNGALEFLFIPLTDSLIGSILVENIV